MSYSYETERPYVLTDEGSRKVMTVRNVADQALKIAGAVRADILMNAASAGDSWKSMAYVDRLVEIGELREIPTDGAWQHRIFVGGHK